MRHHWTLKLLQEIISPRLVMTISYNNNNIMSVYSERRLAKSLTERKTQHFFLVINLLMGTQNEGCPTVLLVPT